MSLRERKKAETLTKIRRAAAELFAERGFQATRTKDIAEAAGIATGTLFNYAATKEAVVLLVWKDRAQSAADAGLHAAQRHSDPIQALDAVFAPIFDFYAEDRELGKVFLHHAVYAAPDDPELVALNAGFVGRIAILLGPHAGSGALLAATNVFAAYYLMLSGFLSGQFATVAQTRGTFRELVRAQSRGW